MLNLPVPLVCWTSEQEQMVKYQPFTLLLRKLGFYLPVDTCKAYIEIPNYWSPSWIFKIYQQLGPVNPGESFAEATVLLTITSVVKFLRCTFRFLFVLVDYLKFDVNIFDDNKFENPTVQVVLPTFEYCKRTMHNSNVVPGVVRCIPL